MARAMYEYTKMVLKKVSFNTDLFCKELEKALSTLLPYEVDELIIWLKQYTVNKPNLYVCFNLVKKNSIKKEAI
ncbi:hypothetical protein [Tenacibaculum aestuariivivum]|uniref:hypothetical protein n=1 Tax=Tenacibaculum aestuariivivum TaxID=2006131 RepID=UPI003AB79718